MKPYFETAERLVYTGDLVSVSRAMRTVEFKVTAVDPAPYCYVGQTTLVVCDKVIKRAVSSLLSFHIYTLQMPCRSYSSWCALDPKQGTSVNSRRVVNLWQIYKFITGNEELYTLVGKLMAACLC